MIRLSEIGDALASIYESFEREYPKTTQALIQQLLNRLKQELTSAATDVDLILVELRSNLESYSKQIFANAFVARNAFKEGTIRKYVKDLEETEIPRILQLAQKLKRFL